MSKKEDSDEECDAGLAVYNKDVNPENVNLSPSHPDEDSFSEGNARPYASSRSFGGGNSRHARVHSLPMYFTNENLVAHPLPTPSRVSSLPSVDTSAWCPSSTPCSDRFPDARIGINMRGSNHTSDIVPSLMMIQSEVSLRSETAPPTPSDDATAAEEKKDSSEEASELCTDWNGISVDTSDPLHPCSKGEIIVEGATSLTTAEGCSSSCNATWSEDNSDAAAAGDDYEGDDYEDTDDDDDEAPPKEVVSLRESFPRNAGASKELTQPSASAVDWSSVGEDVGDQGSHGLFPPEHDAALGFEPGCRGDPGDVTLDDCSPLHCDPSPCSRSSVEFDTGLLNNLPNPPDAAELNAVLGAEAEAHDTGQTARDDDDVEWASCKICWHRPWELVFIPCGHASCRRCYIRLYNKLCPFCRKPIREIVEVHLVCSLEA